MAKSKTPEEKLTAGERKTANEISGRCRAFRAPENITVSRWADKYRMLSSSTSAESGLWQTSRTPYLEEIMNAFSDENVERIVVVSSSQVGKTEGELNMLGYLIDQDPGPCVYCMPTIDEAKKFSKRRMNPLFQNTEPLKSKVSSEKYGNKTNTLLNKEYPGGMMTIVGSNSSSGLAGTPARYIFGDEIDRWTKDADGEGSPWGLLEARTTTFYNRKLVEVSTPTIKGNSEIESAFNLGTKEYWSSKCPECGEYNFIQFNDIKFEYHKVEEGGKVQYIVDKTEYVCPVCGCILPESEMRRAEKKWIARSPEAIKNRCRSFWINAFTSPWMEWKYIVRRFLEAKGDPEKLKVVYNTLFGQLWEQRGDIESEEELSSRAETYRAELPNGVLCLTMGVDTQDNRLEYEVVGYGKYEENWGIERGIIMGRPSDPEVWDKLDGVIDKIYRFENGQGLRISLTFIDSGGHFTQDVYENCAARINKKVFAVKGSNKHDAPYTAPPSKVNIMKNGAQIGKAWLYNIGVDAGKEHIMSGLKVQSPGARYSHFPKSYDSLFYSGILSEYMALDKNGTPHWEKIPGHERNEALDCRNYANAAFRVLHPNLDRIAYMMAHPAEKTTEKPERRKQKRKRREMEDIW